MTPAEIEKKINWDSLPELKKNLNEIDFNKVRNYILNNQPVEKWQKKHPIYGNSYLPIDKVEYLLTSLFGDWWVEIKEVKQIVNSISVTVRLFYSEIGEVKFQDGTGAFPLQFKSKTDVNDFNNLQPNAVMIAAPIAESFAIKDAAEKIGRIFGRDLNRKDLLGYNNILKNVEI